MTFYLQPTGPTARQALLTGDPKRAMELATRLLSSPRMSNLSRGLWGYYGETPDGAALTVQSTGLGGPSAAIVAHEIAGLGVTEAVRVGTCVALAEGPAPGTVVVVDEALPAEDRYDAGPAADTALTERLRGAIAGRVVRARAARIERYYDTAARATRASWAEAGATVADLSTGALLDSGRELGFAVAAALVVAEDQDGKRLGAEELDARLLELGEMAARGLLGAAVQASSETANRD